MFAASSAASHANDAAFVASSTKALYFFAESATAANGRVRYKTQKPNISPKFNHSPKTDALKLEEYKIHLPFSLATNARSWAAAESSSTRCRVVHKLTTSSIEFIALSRCACECQIQVTIVRWSKKLFLHFVFTFYFNKKR